MGGRGGGRGGRGTKISNKLWTSENPDTLVAQKKLRFTRQDDFLNSPSNLWPRCQRRNPTQHNSLRRVSGSRQQHYNRPKMLPHQTTLNKTSHDTVIQSARMHTTVVYNVHRGANRTRAYRTHRTHPVAHNTKTSTPEYLYYIKVYNYYTSFPSRLRRSCFTFPRTRGRETAPLVRPVPVFCRSSCRTPSS